jgi:dTDP-4-amino-4,6-dideoxygalactose transaminase
MTLNVKASLEEVGIAPRRYFYPSLCELDYVSSDKAAVSVDISKRVLCLPLYHELNEAEQRSVWSIIKKNISISEHV